MYSWHWYTSYIYHRKSKLNNKYATIVRLTEENARDYETQKNYVVESMNLYRRKYENVDVKQ